MTQESNWIVRHQLGGGELIHPKAIQELVASSDGRWLGCLLLEGQGVVWERLGGHKHLELAGGRNLGFSHDSQFLFWQQADYIEVIALETGESVRKIGPVEHLEHFSLSPSGEHMALATRSEVFVGAWQTGKLLQRLAVSGESHWATQVAFVSDEHLLCAEVVKGRGSVLFVLREIATGNALWTVPETQQPEGEPLSGTARWFALSPDRAFFASRTASRNTVRIWQTRGGTVVQDIVIAGEIAAVWAFSPDSAQLLLAEGNVLGLFDIPSGEKIGALQAASEITALAFSPAGEQLLAGQHDGRVSVWNLPGWDEAAPTGRGGHQTGVVQLLPLNAECVLCRSSDPELRLLALDIGAELVWSDEAVGLESLVYDAHAGLVVGVRRTDPSVLVEDQQDRVTVQTWKATGEPLAAREYALELPEKVWQPVLSLSPDGNFLAGGGNDQTVRLWNLATGEKVLEVSLFSAKESHASSPLDDDNDIVAMDWWPGTPLLAVRRMSDLRVDLVDVESGKHFFAVAELRSSPVFVAFLPGTTQLVFADFDSPALAHYDLTTGESSLLTSPGPLTALTALPDGKHVALGVKGKVCLYDVAHRQVVAQLPFPFGDITALALTPDGKKLIVGGEHGQLVIWECAKSGGVLPL